MDKKLNENLPIYLQIMDRIRASIISGEMAAGGKVPSVRELAEEFGVNPNTMQRALAELEREGLVISERTAGRFVTKDADVIERTRKQVAEKIVKEFLEKMKELGFTPDQIETFFRDNNMTDLLMEEVI